MNCSFPDFQLTMESTRMASLDAAVETQLKNIEAKTGQSREGLKIALLATGKTKHGELRAEAQSLFGIGYGDANALVHFARASDGARQAEGKSDDAVLEELYAGPKADLRPIHEAVMAAINSIGEFEIAPKKGYLSLRRKKQFAMVGPATKTAVEVGLNQKSLAGTDRLITQPDGGMCSHKIRLSSPAEVDAELVGWLQSAYEGAG
ncbi:MAG: DUF5655 domain-containing protein [Armatimonas sp.]